MDHLGEIMTIDVETVPVVEVARAAEDAIKAVAQRLGVSVRRYYVNVRTTGGPLNCVVLSGGDDVPDDRAARNRVLMEMTLDTLKQLGNAMGLEVEINVRPAQVAARNNADA